MTINGKTSVFRRYSYDENGRLFREISQYGIGIMFRYNQQGKFIGQSYENDGDNATALRIKATEAELLAAINKTSSAAERDVATEKLCFFYIHDLRDPAKAIPYVPQITNQSRRFSILLHSIAFNDKLNSSEKVAAYTVLLQNYPERRSIIDNLAGIAQRQKIQVSP